MIDLKRLKSDFDCEVLLGAEFFRMAIHAWLEAGQIELSYQVVEGGLTVYFDKPTLVEILFESPERTIIGDDGAPQLISTPVDLAVTLPLKFVMPEGDEKNHDLGIFIELQQSPTTNPTTGLVDKMDLNVAYAGMRQESWDWLGENYTIFLPAVLDNKLRENIHKNLSETLLPKDIQKIDLRKLPAEKGFQACYAIYVNLKLKLGPASETTWEGDPPLPLTRILPPEPDDQPVDRGDASLGLNFLPPELALAVGLPPKIYFRLARNQLHTFTEEVSPGVYSRPLKDAMGNVVGHHKDFDLGPSPYPSIMNPKTWALLAVSKTRVEGIDVETKIHLILSAQENGELKVDFDVHEPEADTTFLDVIIFCLGALLTIGLGPITGGLSLAAGVIMSGMTSTMLHAIKESYEEEGQKMVEGMIQQKKDSFMALLTAIPARVTIEKLRLDPFYYRHFQVVTRFQDLNIFPDGMGFTGTVTTGSQDIPISTVKLVGRIRREEPVGDLLQVLYQVPKPEEIMTLADWQRPDPRRPAVFPLTSQEAGQRVKADHLKKWCYIRPERVRLKSGHITELYFDTGVALAPFEAAELHMQQVLFVRGAKLIRPRQGKPYYRSYPDGYPQNNLCNLPPYYSALAVTLAREFTDFNHTVIYVAQNTSETIWHWQPQGGQSVGVVACHAISTYPRLQEMIMALAQGGTVPFCTWQELDTAILRPDWYPEEFQNFDPENFLPKHSQELTELIASLKAGELATMGLVPLLGETLSTQRLIERLLDYLWGRLNLMLVIKDAFMKQEG